MKLLNGILTLLVIAISVSCGKSNSSKNAKKITTISEAQIAAVMGNQSFECASLDGSGCPEGIARLLILDKEDADRSAVCSGFMIGEDTLVTNNHCIANQAACKNTYVAIYNGYSYEQAKCKTLLKAMNDYQDSNDERKELDVAVIKLDRTFWGKYFRPSKDKVNDSQEITAWVIDHTGLDKDYPNLFESRVTEFKCKSNRNSGRRSLILDNCPVINGNSGSPAFNDKGEVVGVIWGGTGSDINSSLEIWKRRSLDKHAAVTEVQHFISWFSSK